MATETAELLRRYAGTGCENAFRELVERHSGLVYSIALRWVAGDVSLAQDVTQTVFCDLARKAHSLQDGLVLAGWLYRHTCLKAAEAVRTESRRRVREQLATEIKNMDAPDDSTWRELAPVLDDALQRLPPTDRDALVLRFFQNASLRGVGEALGVSEDAAQKRVARALDRMREQLGRQGIACSVAALSSTLSLHAAPTVPAAFAATLPGLALTAAASASGAAGTTFTSTLLSLMASTKLKLSVAALVAASLTTPLIYQHYALQRLRATNSELQQQLTVLQQAPAAAVVSVPEPPDSARLAEQNELLRLRGQVTQLRRENEELLRQSVAAKAGANRPAAASGSAADPAWVQQVLDSPPAMQGSAAGALRGKLLRGEREAVSASEVALRDALLQRQLNQTLERSPADFADFQAAYIQAAVGITDNAKIEQIHQIIRQTYEHAVAQGLDIPSKPTTDTDPWVQRRHQLDRRSTAAVQGLLTPEEKSLFDRAFLGVMGVDLGGVGVDKSNYPKGFLGP